VRSNAPMRTQIGTLIIATSLVQLANGFFGTFIALRVAIEDFGAGLAGLVLSSYFAGFTVGALRCGRIIERVGHIRAYAAFGGLVAAATAAMPLLVKPLPWLALRAVIGFGCAGLFITTESWLNAKALPQDRGRVFSIYMGGTFAALAAGQLLIAGARVAAAAPFNVMVVLFAVALVMVSTTRAEPPRIAAGPMLPAGQLARAAPIAVVGSALSGLIAGTFYTLVPAYLQGAGIDRATIAQVMFAAVIGGLAFQVPIGRLSDRFDRRRVLAGLGVGLAGTALALIFVPRTLATVLPPAALLGGFLSTVYPVCVAHAHDCMPADRVVAVSERLILVSGVGSVLGPLVGSEIMAHLGIDGVIYFMAAGALALAGVASLGSLGAASPLHQERPFDILTPQASPLGHDPRSDPGEPLPPDRAGPARAAS
jgi:MFS family permease